MIGVPGLHPGAHALLQVGDDLVGDAAIDVLPIASSCRRCVGLLAAGAPPLLGLLDMNTHGSGSLPGRAGESLSLASETRRDRTRDPLALAEWRSEEHTSELQSLMRISYAVFCLKNKNKKTQRNTT